MVRILFIGVFDTTRRSTNTSQLLAFKKLGHHVVGYNYRAKATAVGTTKRDQHLFQTVRDQDFDLVVYSKCNQISYETFKKINEITTTCLWFMDPLRTYDEEMRKKTQLVDYFCCDKKNVLEVARLLNPRSFHICEGFDEDVDTPVLSEKVYDVSFIGNIYGSRAETLHSLDHPAEHITGCYGTQHAAAVGKTRINLNFCTDGGASDRIYKILAAGGFLLSDDWHGRSTDFTDGEELVIFKGTSDLNRKIKYYLAHQEEAASIAHKGQKKVQEYTRQSWAKRIVEHSNDV
mgnify:FL=1|jgi:hypothetical protein